MPLSVFNVLMILILVAIPILVVYVFTKFRFDAAGNDGSTVIIIGGLTLFALFSIWIWQANKGHKREAHSYGVLPSRVHTICDTGYTDKCVQVAMVEGKLINVSKEVGVYVPEGYGLTTIEYKRSWSALTYKDYPIIYWVQKITKDTPQGSHGK